MIKSVLDLAEQVFNDLSTRIVPTKQRKYFRPAMATAGDVMPLMDHIYVAEKFLLHRFEPLKYQVVASKAVASGTKNRGQQRRIDRFRTLLETADPRINDPGERFFPHSAKRYFTAPYQDPSRRRYVPDPSAEFYGIRHIYLDKAEDTLLFYVRSMNRVILLNAGTHLTLYKPETLAILLEEFADVAQELGIVPLPIDPGPGTAPEEVKARWDRGLSVLLRVGEKVYMGYPMTLSSMNMQIGQYHQNLLYHTKMACDQVSAEMSKKGLSAEGTSWKLVPDNLMETLRNGLFSVFNESTGFLAHLPIRYFSRVAAAYRILGKTPLDAAY